MTHQTKRILKRIAKAIGTIFALALFILPFIVFVYATPEQASAECEWWGEQDPAWRAAR